MMPGLGERFSEWIEERRLAWGDTLKGWMTGWAEKAIEVFLDVIAQKAKVQLKPLLDALEASTEIPPEVKPFLDELRNPTGELAGLNAVGIANRVTGGAVNKLLDAVFLDIAYNINARTMRLRESEQDFIQLWMKGFISGQRLEEGMRIHGYSPELTRRLQPLWQVYLPTDVVLPARLRDKTRWTDLVDDLKHLGLSERQLELLTEMAYKIPNVQDIIRYVVKEVYDPATYKRFGQDQEYPSMAEADAEKAGVRPDHLLKEWIAHWNLPGTSQGFDMLHRGEIGPDDLNKLLKALDIMPFWRDKLTAISWDLPGRIELRMMARYGLVDKAFLLEALKKTGLAEEYRDIVADMNLVLGLRSDLQTRYSKGYLTAAQVAEELAASGMSEGIRSRLYQYIIKNESGARTAAQKNLTLAQIIKGVKKGTIDRAQGLDLILDLGYENWEARLILDTEIPEDETDAAVNARELTKADILAGLKAGTMTLEDAKKQLLTLRYRPADSEFILKTYLATVKPPAEPALKEASKADIVAAVKMGLITPEQGYVMLTSIGYTSDAANFILLVKADVSPFSPVSFDEFKNLTTTFRRSQGMEVEDITPEARGLRLAQAKAVIEGRTPLMEQLRINIDTIRRQRRAGMITREQELAQLRKLDVPADYVNALVANDDTRLAAKQQPK